MKKTQCIELIKKIRNSAVSFVAISILVTCAIALFAGMEWCQTSLSLSLDQEFDNDKLHDIEIAFPFGADKSDVDRILAQENISTAEGQYTSFQYFRWEQSMLQARLTSITHKVDCLVVLEGQLPKAFDEIAVDERWAADHRVHLGDTITFEHDENGSAHLLHSVLTNNPADAAFRSEDGMQYLTTDRFTVTALVRSPAFISALAAVYESSPTFSTPVNCLMFVTEEAFDLSSFNGFTSVLVRSERLLNMPTSSNPYKETAREIGENLRPIADEITEERYNEILTAIDSFNDTPFESIAESLRTGLSRQSCTLLMREDNGSIVMSGVVSDMFGKFKFNSALVLVIISVLICYSTILRLVFIDTKLIGTRRAVGFTDREIILPYLIYAFAATALGVLVGLIAARFLVQPLLIGVMNDTFRFGEAVYYFSFGDAILYFTAEVIVMLLFAYIACGKTMKRKTTELLAGPEPPASKKHIWENTAVWKKFSVLFKSIINNFINDKRRVIATLIGIAGCTALVVSSFSFEFAVTGSLPKQFSQLQHFDTVVYYNSDVEGCGTAIGDALSDVTDRYAEVYFSNAFLKAPDDKSVAAFLIVGDGDMNGLMPLYQMDGTVASPEMGIWIPYAYAKYYHLQEGDDVTYMDSSSAEHTVKIAGIYESYLQCPRMILSPAEYEAEYGTAPTGNAFLLSSEGSDLRIFDDLLGDINGYICTTDYYANAENSQSTVVSLTTAFAILYTVLSVVIALLVLLDLLVMFVEERKKELITLMINGYSAHDAKRYIYSDTILLAVVGILLGTVGGVLLGQWNTSSTESELSCFLRQISFPACVIGITFTALLIAGMTLIAMKRISTFELSDINKGE